MNSTTKVLENRLRLTLARRGFRLRKFRNRDPHALTYGRYQIYDAATNELADGLASRSLSLAEVQGWIDHAFLEPSS